MDIKNIKGYFYLYVTAWTDAKSFLQLISEFKPVFFKKYTFKYISFYLNLFKY